MIPYHSGTNAKKSPVFSSDTAIIDHFQSRSIGSMDVDPEDMERSAAADSILCVVKQAFVLCNSADRDGLN